MISVISDGRYSRMVTLQQYYDPILMFSDSLVVDNDSETEVSSESDSKFVWKSKAKVRRENVSLPQWISANVRILKQLIQHDTIDINGIEAYLDYTAQIGHHCKVYTTPSLMLNAPR